MTRKSLIRCLYFWEWSLEDLLPHTPDLEDFRRTKDITDLYMDRAEISIKHYIFPWFRYWPSGNSGNFPMGCFFPCLWRMLGDRSPSLFLTLSRSSSLSEVNALSKKWLKYNSELKKGVDCYCSLDDKADKAQGKTRKVETWQDILILDILSWGENYSKFTLVHVCEWTKTE